MYLTLPFTSWLKSRSWVNSNLSQGVALHAVASPLSTIVLSIELALVQIDRNSQLYNSLLAAYSSAVHVRQMVSAYGQSLRLIPKQNISLQELITTCKLIFEPAHPDAILHCKICNQQQPLRANFVMMQELLLCLLKNSYQAYSDISQNKVIMIDITLNGDSGAIRVIDGGCGMNRWQKWLALYPHISFRKNGQGLGLAFVKSVAKEHLGGGVVIYSRPGSGCTVEIVW